MSGDDEDVMPSPGVTALTWASAGGLVLFGSQYARAGDDHSAAGIVASVCAIVAVQSYIDGNLRPNCDLFALWESRFVWAIYGVLTLCALQYWHLGQGVQALLCVTCALLWSALMVMRSTRRSE